jgi:hypothetical protein
MFFPKTLLLVLLGLLVLANAHPIHDCIVTGQRKAMAPFTFYNQRQPHFRTQAEQSIEVAWIFTGGNNLQAQVVMTWETGVGGGSERKFY